MQMNPDYILSSDWHLRLDKPIARIDNFIEAQTKKIKFILSLSQKYNAPILIAGDISHRSHWGDRLLNYFIDILKDFPDVKIYVVCGQHDLPNHRLDKWEESGLGVLHKKGCLEVLTESKLSIYPFSYSCKIKNAEDIIKQKRRVALAHRMVLKSQKHKLFPKQKANSAAWLLKKHPCYDLMVTGDNHQAFVVKHEGRLLVNPGSIMRSTAAQINFKPRVYLWYSEKNKVKIVYLPIEDDIVSREHIEQVEKRDERIQSFVNRLRDDHEISFSFEQNVKEFLQNNKDVHKKVKDKIWKSINNE